MKRRMKPVTELQGIKQVPANDTTTAATPVSTQPDPKAILDSWREKIFDGKPTTNYQIKSFAFETIKLIFNRFQKEPNIVWNGGHFIRLTYWNGHKSIRFTFDNDAIWPMRVEFNDVHIAVDGNIELGTNSIQSLPNLAFLMFSGAYMLAESDSN